jgi:nucleoside-diphosphate-sugar epimerase
MKILVTGGGGFLGQALCEGLLARGPRQCAASVAPGMRRWMRCMWNNARATSPTALR